LVKKLHAFLGNKGFFVIPTQGHRGQARKGERAATGQATLSPGLQQGKETLIARPNEKRWQREIRNEKNPHEKNQESSLNCLAKDKGAKTRREEKRRGRSGTTRHFIKRPGRNNRRALFRQNIPSGVVEMGD